MKKTLLIIFTFKYPFEPPTEQFLDDELRFLAEEDMDILLVPSAREKKDAKYAFPETRENISVCEIRRSCLPCETFFGLLSAAGQAGCLRRDLGRIRKEAQPQNRTYARKETLKEYVQAGALCRHFIRQIPDGVLRNRDRIILYSYWLNPAAAAEALFKKHLERKYRVSVTAYARAHGDGDLYRQGMDHCRPCLALLNEEIDAVFPISRNGLESLEKDGIRRAETYRLGVKKQVPFLPSRNATPLVVSCSVVNENKRVEKIADILSCFRQDIRWVHFGGGPGEQSLRVYCEKVLPGNVRWDLRGWTSHDDIMDFYRKETPDLFLNVSLMEGIPVSIMEAMSYSIPCAATDAGASGEIVADGRNGFLLSVDFDVRETARRIGDHLSGDEETKTCMRENAYAAFEREYDSAANYAAFARRIVSDGADAPRKPDRTECSTPVKKPAEPHSKMNSTMAAQEADHRELL